MNNNQPNTNLPDIPARPWKKKVPPSRILVMRFQAMGDMVITLPYLQALRNALPPTTRIDLLTRKEVDSIPRNIILFDKIYSIGGKRNVKKIFLDALLKIPRLWTRRYDVVIDLQNNIISSTVRKALFPRAWSVFDRWSPIAAGERTRQTIQASGIVHPNQLPHLGMDTRLQLKEADKGLAILKRHGHDPKTRLIVLNPAGAFATRNWPIENYIAFARLCIKARPDCRLLILGTPLIAAKATLLEKALGTALINLVGLTTPLEAFAILQHAKLVLSEDSGLMHMSWVSGIPTLALFGGTRSDWSRPLGTHSLLLDSSDLACGNCMKETCRYADTHCLTRYSPELVFSKAWQLLQPVGW